MLVDTHAHLYLDAFDADRDAVVARAHAAGVGVVIQPAVDVASIEDALALCDAYDGVWAMAAVHPTYVADAAPDALARVGAALADRRVLAVGESGLDYYWSRDHEQAQRASLRAHARLAVRHGLPLVLHNRDRKGSDDASRDLVQIVREVQAEGEGTLGGVFHCFGGPAWLAAEVLDLGFHVGLGGTLTFKNAGVAEAVAEVPLDRIVLETDAPYLAPTPHRGGRNEPAYTALVAQRLADVRGLPVEEVAERTTATARALFSIPDAAPPA
ncbi:TatD family hydrolase [Rubrivirga sp. S365]|uniref:TatD family hydrolase n=1 Tax=Rubrivirga litoralis TaxID=3075598 RepID=A0ABU3BUU9_9BACT|nr:MULTISPECIES: TatD family hydrolase [unclassified Rubrivirga]MDT0633069.1 TatD family hydrolase [Rubrivirga sp. F394]MDT7857136.1 TatD family hydrolase [Rubrivirga sp. S365]